MWGGANLMGFAGAQPILHAGYSAEEVLRSRRVGAGKQSDGLQPAFAGFHPSYVLTILLHRNIL